MILHATLTVMQMWEKKNQRHRNWGNIDFFFFKKRKDYTKISYITMTSMKDKNTSKTRFFLIENISHTILEVQEKE